jgi:hypothetical protein
MWTSGEADRLVAGGEFDIEPGDEGVDVVGSADREVEGSGEGEVLGSAGVEIEGEDSARFSDDGFEVDSVHEGLGEGGEFERGVVEAVDAVPDCIKPLSALRRCVRGLI